MNSITRSIFTSMAMIVLIFTYGSAIASQNIITKSTFSQTTDSTKHLSEKAIVLTKGQNQLPEQVGYKKEC